MTDTRLSERNGSEREPVAAAVFVDDEDRSGFSRLQTSDFVPILQAAAMLGVTPNTLVKRLDRAGIATRPDRFDRRKKLLRRDDLALLVRPGDRRPTDSERGEAVAS
jgi:hypothetical protein